MARFSVKTLSRMSMIELMPQKPPPQPLTPLNGVLAFATMKFGSTSVWTARLRWKMVFVTVPVDSLA